MTTENPAISTNAPVVTDNSTSGNNQPIKLQEDPKPAEVQPVVPAATDPAAKETPEWAQKRINELTAKRYEAERTAEQLAQ